MYYNYINFAPSNYNIFETSDDKIFSVRFIYANTVKIILYTNPTEKNRVDKSTYLRYIGEIEGIFRENTSIQNPIFKISMVTPPTFNYVHIPNFERYYYVTSITSLSNNLWEIELKCDVLMSFKTDILNQTCFIKRQENEYNDYLIDEFQLFESKSNISIKSVINFDFFNIDNGVDRIILTIAKP